MLGDFDGLLKLILAGGSLVRNVFYQPYFMLYGEVYAPDIDPKCNASMFIYIIFLVNKLLHQLSCSLPGNYNQCSESEFIESGHGSGSIISSESGSGSRVLTTKNWEICS
jgi:hypothetical protein